MCMFGLRKSFDAFNKPFDAFDKSNSINHLMHSIDHSLHAINHFMHLINRSMHLINYFMYSINHLIHSHLMNHCICKCRLSSPSLKLLSIFIIHFNPSHWRCMTVVLWPQLLTCALLGKAFSQLFYRELFLRYLFSRDLQCINASELIKLSTSTCGLQNLWYMHT